MSVLVEFAMFPTDKGASVSEYVSRIVKLLRSEPVNYQLTPMGSIFETNTMDEALSIIARAYSVLEPDCGRVYSTVKFDIRKDRQDAMNQKMASIEFKLNH